MGLKLVSNQHCTNLNFLQLGAYLRIKFGNAESISSLQIC